ncbi:hypothetical protein X945_5910 [Burkholderia pseudomallei ABCPW 107]|nr:hypothetical protein X945_5910 [Burkholderia pseudomallei ABCPW 107]
MIYILFLYSKSKGELFRGLPARCRTTLKSA